MMPFLLTAAVAASAWVAPLPPPMTVERPFVAPAAPWGAGHRGVDLTADPGTPVRAAGDGTVVFAAPLAGRYVIALAHPWAGLGPGWRTTYEGVRPHVVLGQSVVRGEVIGVLDRSGGHCTCLHWGLRNANEYADPLRLLARPIVLKPGASGPGVRLLVGGTQPLH